MEIDKSEVQMTVGYADEIKIDRVASRDSGGLGTFNSLHLEVESSAKQYSLLGILLIKEEKNISFRVGGCGGF